MNVLEAIAAAKHGKVIYRATWPGDKYIRSTGSGALTLHHRVGRGWGTHTGFMFTQDAVLADDWIAE